MKHSQRRNRNQVAFQTLGPPRRGFTLIELLVVIAIIGVLIALLLPAINMVKEASRKARCASNLHQVGIGMHSYLTANKAFPPGQKSPCVGCATFSWITLLLPYIEETVLADKVNLKKDPRTKVNREAVSTSIPLLVCPSTSHRQQYRTIEDKIAELNNNGVWDEFSGEEMACTDYAGIDGPAKSHINAVTKRTYGENQGVLLKIVDPARESLRIGPRQIADGLSYTFMIAESTGQGAIQSSGTWTVPGAWCSGDNLFAVKIGVNPAPDIAWANAEIFSDHSGGSNTLFCDGAIRFFNSDISLDVLCALASRSGGEFIPSESLP